jgi:hypothetical protein
MKVSVIVSAYHDNLRLRRCLGLLKHLPKDYEVLVSGGKGKGGSLVATAQKAKGDIVVSVDSDFDGVYLIPAYVQQLKDENADVLVFRRKFMNGRPLVRRVASGLFRGYAKTLFGELPDTQCGFKVFRKEVLRDSYLIDGFAWDVEFVVDARRDGFKVLEVPYSVKYKSSGFSVGGSFLGMGFDVFRFWLSDSWNKLFFVLALAYLAALVTASASMSIPLGTDVHFHFSVAEVWARGENGMFSQVVMGENLFPYPPVFHWLLVPAVWTGTQLVVGRVFQTVLPFGIFLCTCLFVSRHVGPKACAVAGLVLISSVGFTDGAIQCRPMGLSMLLLPFVFHYLLSENGRGFVVCNSLVGYTHGVAGLASTWLLMLRGFLCKKTWKTALLAVLFLVPLAVVSVAYFGGAVDKWGGHMDTYQEYLLFTEPLSMLPYYAGVSLLGWLFVVLVLARWNGASEFSKTLTLSLLGLTIMIPFWADRFLQYSMISLACLVGVGVSKDKRLVAAFVPMLAVLAVANLINLFWITFTGNWWLYPQS